jgi:hypothetical protein
MFTPRVREWLRKAADVVFGRPQETPHTLLKESRCLQFPEVVVPTDVYLIRYQTARPRWPFTTRVRYEALLEFHQPLPLGYGQKPMRTLRVPDARTTDVAIIGAYESVRVFRPDVQQKGGGVYVRA